MVHRFLARRAEATLTVGQFISLGDTNRVVVPEIYFGMDAFVANLWPYNILTAR